MPDLPVHSEPVDRSSTSSESTPKQLAGLQESQSVPEASRTHSQPRSEQARKAPRPQREDSRASTRAHRTEPPRRTSTSGARSAHYDDPLFGSTPSPYAEGSYDDPYAPAPRYGADGGYGAPSGYGAAAGFSSDSGYSSRSSYGSASGYGADAGHSAGSSYAADSGYGSRYSSDSGHRADSDYGSRQGYPSEGYTSEGYSSEGYSSESYSSDGYAGGFDAQAGYGASRGEYPSRSSSSNGFGQTDAAGYAPSGSFGGSSVSTAPYSAGTYGQYGGPLSDAAAAAYAQDAPVYSPEDAYSREDSVPTDLYSAAVRGDRTGRGDRSDFADTDHFNLVDAALTEFSHYGFNEARLERIALASGVSKRMIHYYFGDKKGLYIETLRLAATLLRPDPDTLTPTTNVPVDAMRELVNVIVERFFAEPRAARVLALENLLGILPKDTELGLFGQSPMVLEIDRLLMLGQDYGAFRPGVSAIDIYLLISALSMFPVYNQYTFRSMYGVTIGNESNREGLRIMVQDVVISFLTTMMPSRQGDSYTVTTAALHTASLDAIIFDDGGAYAEDAHGEQTSPNAADALDNAVAGGAGSEAGVSGSSSAAGGASSSAASAGASGGGTRADSGAAGDDGRTGGTRRSSRSSARSSVHGQEGSDASATDGDDDPRGGAEDGATSRSGRGGSRSAQGSGSTRSSRSTNGTAGAGGEDTRGRGSASDADDASSSVSPYRYAEGAGLGEDYLRDDRIVTSEHERAVDQPSTNPFDQQFGPLSSFYEE